MKPMLRRAVVVTLLTATAFVAPPPEFAAAGFAATGSGSGRALAQTVSTAATPTASATLQDVTVSWTATTLSGGTPVTGYIVRRYNGALVQQTILAGCASVATNGCVENNVPAGTWTYSVQATRGNWLGAESARSSSVTVTTAVFTINTNQKVKAAATVTGGALSGYAANETITFRLDSTSGTVLTGSISSVNAGGSATGFTVTIPAGPSQGNHTIVAIGGTSGAVATSNTFLFDSVVPTNTLSLGTKLNAYLNGLNLYFRANAAGNFTIVDTVADAGSGPASATFPNFPTAGWTMGNGSVSTPAGGPFTSATYSWTANPTTPGGTAATRTVTGFDAAANSVASVITFVSDITAPAIVTADVILAPVGNTTTMGFIGQGKAYYVYAKATDGGSGVATMTANASTITTGVTAEPMVAGSYTVAGVTYGWRTAAVTATNPRTAGSYNIRATATDNVGNATTSPNTPTNVVVDNTIPTGDVTAPANGGFAPASTTVTSNSADPATNISGVYSAEFQYDPPGVTSWTTITTDYATPFSFVWDTTALAAGSYRLRVITTDNASNTFTSATVTVTLDPTPPAAPSTPILAPASDGGVQGDNRTNDATPTMTGTAEVGSTVRLYDGVTQVGTVVATGGTWSITASTLGTGAHTITATATDTAGNISVSSGSVVVTIDTTQPSVTGVVIADGPGVAGTVDAGDTGTLTYSETMNATTFCSTWTNSGTQTLTNVTVTIVEGADTLSVSTVSCTMGLGLWFVGDYVDGGNATFTNSTVSWNPTTNQISVTLGALGTFTAFKTGVSPAVNEYTGSAPRADLAGNPIVTTKFTAPAASGF